MIIGIPREIKPLEGRVGLIPAACADLVHDGHRVLVQTGAGEASGYLDDEYRVHGVELVADAPSLYVAADLIIKVKEPVGPDLDLLRCDQLLFSYLHLAADEALTRRLLDIGLTAIAFETVEVDGRLPLLAPMSDIAGRIATQVGTHLLHRPQQGKGVLLGGLPGAPRGRVVVLGGGVAGGNAARLAAALGAQVTVFDRQREKMAAMRDLGANVDGLYPFRHDLAQAVAQADLVIGAVLIPGARAPKLVSADMVRTMQAGSVIIDIAIDQGGCIETIHATDYRDPSYQWEGVTHFAVTNMPGAVPRTASQALSAAVLPYACLLAGDDWSSSPALQRGINVEGGLLRYPALQDLFPNLPTD
jgi:alanine dehydrogenase